MKKKITVMTKMERIAAAIRGDAVDTVPYSLWRSEEHTSELQSR